MCGVNQVTQQSNLSQNKDVITMFLAKILVRAKSHAVPGYKATVNILTQTVAVISLLHSGLSHPHLNHTI